MRLGRQMLDMVNQWGKPFKVDAALQVVTKDFGVGYIHGNAHTHRGRFWVWFPEESDGFPTSLDEIDSMTDEAAVWITGFLQGCAPDISDYLGNHDGVETEEELARWRAFCERFVKTGLCPPLNTRPTRPVPISERARGLVNVQNWTPWSFAGERVWVQHGEVWVEVDPQPEVDEYGTLVGSECDRRGHHESVGENLPAKDDLSPEDALPLEWDVCADCGFTQYRPGTTVLEADN